MIAPQFPRVIYDFLLKLEHKYSQTADIIQINDVHDVCDWTVNIMIEIYEQLPC